MTNTIDGKGVDVQKEFRLMRLRFVNCATHSGSDKSFAEGACSGFDEARAAVAELIEAARKVVDRDPLELGFADDVDALEAALARATGATA
jgi:hypothetical protein